MTTQAYYVTMTWDDWPEGGSYGTVVYAESDEQAEQMCKEEMAASRTEECGCRHCDCTDADCGDGYDGFCADCADRIENGEDLADTDDAMRAFLAAYEDKWHVVDCFTLQDFYRLHKDEIKIS